MEQKTETKKSVQEIVASFPWTPHQDRVVVLPDPPEFILPSGIIIPDTAQERPQSGVIIALGNEMSMSAKMLEYQIRILEIIDPTFQDDDEPDLRINSKPGDRVLFGKYAGLEITIENQPYLVLRFADVMATLR